MAALLAGSALLACGSPPERVAPRELPLKSLALSASPPIASAVVADPTTEKDIALAQAAEPPQVWSYPTDGGEPVSIAGVVVIKEPRSLSISGIAPATGKRVWNLPAPAGVSFGSFEKGKDAVFVGGYSPVGGTLSRVDPKTGKLVWHIEGPNEVQLGHDGTGGVVPAKNCASSVLNLAVGRVIGKPFSDTEMEVHSFERDPDSPVQFRTQCERTTWPLIERSGVTLITQGHRSAQKLLGVNALGATSYTIDTRGGHARVAFIDGDEVVLLLLGDRIEAMRVNVVSGSVRFRKQLASEESCGKDSAGYYAEAVRSPKEKPRLFVRGCGRAQLIDVENGASEWSVDVGGDAAFLTGVATEPWEEHASLQLGVTGSAAARLFDPSGKVVKTIALPKNVREVMPVAGGVVATNSGLDVTAFYDEAGLRWRLPLQFGNSFLLGQRFMILGSRAAAQVVIDPSTGSAFVVSGCGAKRCTSGSPYAIGQVGELWLTTRLDPSELVAVRPPP